ncbi:hypothetical protein GW916_13695 [bacterium]|nr:hypothetical protein [bacterium]
MMGRSFVALALLTLLSCGGERSTSEAVVGLMGGLQSSSSSLSSISTLGENTLKMRINRLGRQVLMANHTSPNSLSVCDSFEDSIQNDLGSSCSLGSCSGNLTSSLSFTVNCTQINDSVKCGSSTYTLSNFAYTATMAYTVSGAVYNFTYDMDMNGNVDGGGLAGVVDCTMGFDFAYDSSATTVAEPTLDCNDLNFSCSVAGATLSCADLQTGAGEFSCQ